MGRILRECVYLSQSRGLLLREPSETIETRLWRSGYRVSHKQLQDQSTFGMFFCGNRRVEGDDTFFLSLLA